MQERSARQDLECDKISLERQVKRSLGDGLGWRVGVGVRGGGRRRTDIEPPGVLTRGSSHLSQNKDLKTRLASSEGFQKPSASFSQLEAQNQQLQEQLQAEER